MTRVSRINKATTPESVALIALGVYPHLKFAGTRLKPAVMVFPYDDELTWKAIHLPSSVLIGRT
jgi:hypothetical protein